MVNLLFSFRNFVNAAQYEGGGLLPKAIPQLMHDEQQLYIAWTFVNLKKTYNTPQRPVLPIQPKSKCAWLPVKSVAMICLWAIGDLAREAYGYDTSSSR